MITPDGEMLLVTADGTIIRADPDAPRMSACSLIPTAVASTSPEGSALRAASAWSLSCRRIRCSLSTPMATSSQSSPDVSPTPRLPSPCNAYRRDRHDHHRCDRDRSRIRRNAPEVDQGFVTATSTDGCTVATAGANSPQLLADGRAVDVDADAIIAVVPDGSSYVTVDGRTHHSSPPVRSLSCSRMNRRSFDSVAGERPRVHRSRGRPHRVALRAEVSHLELALPFPRTAARAS